MYQYKAKVIKVVDGDTLKLNIDLGLRIMWAGNCRLANINAPEMSTDQGPVSKAFLENLCPVGSEYVIQSEGLDKYGRPIVTIYKEGKTINEMLLKANMAVNY